MLTLALPPKTDIYKERISQRVVGRISVLMHVPNWQVLRRRHSEECLLELGSPAQSDYRSEDGPLWTCPTSCLEGGIGVVNRGTQTLGLGHSRRSRGGRDDERHCPQRAEPPEPQSRSSAEWTAAPSC
ncbi:unnamed protein product [Phytophthora fragariaefolia]|uniref:Unnamed protein product n=1 Tax=Phytophthora fragariaefolia TaxID=1490495 RepID=A0A9W6U6G7_9STRA|nr:unnamed protein product [Phytophthora fragariaefolia]